MKNAKIALALGMALAFSVTSSLVLSGCGKKDKDKQKIAEKWCKDNAAECKKIAEEAGATSSTSSTNQAPLATPNVSTETASTQIQ